MSNTEKRDSKIHALPRNSDGPNREDDENNPVDGILEIAATIVSVYKLGRCFLKGL
jgi:hypothetical protein